MDTFMSLIFMWPVTRIPVGYLACQGQLLSISEYDALFALIGTTFGGDGVTTFALPDLRSRIPVGAGQGTGLSPWQLGGSTGTESVTLTTANMPAHTHIPSVNITPGTLSAALPSPINITASLPVSANAGSSRTPGSGLSFAQAPDTSSYGTDDLIYGAPVASAAGIPVTVNIPGQGINVPPTVALNGNSDISGSNMPHENRQPYLAVNYLICTQGLYPPQP